MVSLYFMDIHKHETIQQWHISIPGTTAIPRTWPKQPISQHVLLFRDQSSPQEPQTSESPVPWCHCILWIYTNMNQYNGDTSLSLVPLLDQGHDQNSQFHNICFYLEINPVHNNHKAQNLLYHGGIVFYGYTQTWNNTMVTHLYPWYHCYTKDMIKTANFTTFASI